MAKKIKGLNSIESMKGSTKRVGKSFKQDLGIMTLLILLGAFMMLPIYLAFITSFKPVQELFIFPPKFYVIDPTFDNFSDLFKLAGNLWVPFSRYVFNSAFITIVVTLANVFLSSTCAFVLAKIKFPGAKFLNELIVVALLFNSTVTYIMQYMVMAKMGIINTYWALILPQIATPLGLFLMRQSCSTIPDAMIEAAKVDGAGLFRICWKIVMPNLKPAFLTLIIFAFQASWATLGGNFIYDEALKTLPTIIQQIAAGGLARATVAAASAVVLMIPPFALFIAAQSNVMETMAHSGIKD